MAERETVEKMREIVLEGRMLSPMYSYGAYQAKGEEGNPRIPWHPGHPEFRASELKGMMRSLYRMAYPGGVERLAISESDLFGGMVGNTEEDQGHASPIQLIVRSDQKGENDEERLLLHGKVKGNPPMSRPNHTWKGYITIRSNKQVGICDQRLREIAGLDWYRDLAVLSLLLCGLGKRSRKGRGRIEIKEQLFENKEQALEWICKVLNKLASAAGAEYQDYYKITRPVGTGNGGAACITGPKRGGKGQEADKKGCMKKGERELRPMIQKIILGEKLRGRAGEPGLTGAGEQRFSIIKRYLRAVDEACHNWKDPNKNLYIQQAASEHQRWIDPIGSGSPRLASSLIIGFIRAGEEIYPTYLFVNAVKENKKNYGRGQGHGDCPQREGYKEVDRDCKLRESFIREVMKLYC